MASLQLRHLGKTYNNGFTAIRDLDLEIRDREFMVFAGPVGCGVSTVLRMIAGLEEITEGELLMDGQRMNEIAAMDRNVSMIFKNGTLYPHMSVRRNLAFGLELMGLTAEEIDRRIAETAERLGLAAILDKATEELTELEAAHVVVGRALVREPKVFLLDEPFADSSEEVKRAMRELIFSLHERTPVTCIFVTHNREDISDAGERIAIMNDGVLQQVGRLNELCENPHTPYVAEFFGWPVRDGSK